MTNRTASLLMLFVAALLATGVAMAIVLRVPLPGWTASPWLAPATALVCYTLIFFMGRRHILPRPVAESSLRSVVTLLAMILITLAAAMSVTWGLRELAGGVGGGATVTLVLWFMLLWVAVRWQNRFRLA